MCRSAACGFEKPSGAHGGLPLTISITTQPNDQTSARRHWCDSRAILAVDEGCGRPPACTISGASHRGVPASGGRGWRVKGVGGEGGGRHVLSLGTILGFSGPDTPAYDNFYAGGYNTMRGFVFRGASPRQTNASGQEAIVGGPFEWLNTVEYMFPITADDSLRGVVFTDFGTVESNVTIKDFRVAPGFGLRITMPALGPAPIALDFAVPVSYADFDSQQLFSFFVGFAR